MSDLGLIYIRLIEGVETWVPVSAIEMDKSIYKITGNEYLQLDDDATGIWEFFPGDIVRCKNSDGDTKAFELISSSFPKRRVHQLIYLVVSKLGRIMPEEIQSYEKELLELCTSNDIFQKNHPTVKEWLKFNCRTNKKVKSR